jgi:dihydroflavonol-4-reductase
MNVLITGATGFLGAHLAAACVARGDRVRILRRAGSSLRALADLPVEHIVGDLLDRHVVAQAVQGCDLVFHAAAIASYWRATREQIMLVNVEGTRTVIDACLRAGTPRVVFTSSAAAVGIAVQGAANEETPFDTLSATFTYARSKREAEAIVRAAVAQGLSAVIVNPAAVIGPADHYLNSSSIVREYATGRIPVVPPGGICLVDVDAVTQGHLSAAAHGRAGERYILGGENLSFREIAGMIAQAAGVHRPRLVVPALLLSVAAPAVELINRLTPGPPKISSQQVLLSRANFFFDSGKAVRELGYPLLPARAAIERALAWYRGNGYL